MPDVYFNKKPKRPSGSSGNGKSNSQRGASYGQNQNRRNYNNQYYNQYNSEYDHFEDIDSGRRRSSSGSQQRSSQNRRTGSGQGNRNADRYYQQNAQRRSNSPSSQRQQQYRQQPSRQQQYRQQQYRQPPKNPQKKRRGCFRSGCSTAIIAVLLVLVIIYVAIGETVFSKMNYDPDQHKSNEYISSFDLKKSSRVKNILLIGVDARQGDTVSRADTMMLVSIDKKNKKIKMTSFLRDSYVSIPGHGKNKLNAACTYGGIQLVIDTLEYNYKVKIDNYMAVDFTAFTELIDAIGGVNVPITETEAAYLNSTWYKWSLTGNKVTFQSGDSVHLTGEKALMFCRIRKLDSDVMRTKRQRLVIAAVKSKLSSLSLSQINKISKNVLPNIQTDISKFSMENLAISTVLFYRNYKTAQMPMPNTGDWYDETVSGAGEVVAFDVDASATKLQQFIYDDVYEESTSSSY